MASFTDSLIGPDRRVVFFGGKGGVGKTTLASAAATDAALHGRRVLVVSTDPAHNVGHLWNREIARGGEVLYTHDSGGSVTGLEIDPAATARTHFEAVARTVTAMMPEHLHREVNRYFAAAEGSPGAHEAALMERMAQIATTLTLPGFEEPFDLVIFDTAPTGHTTRLLELPDVMTAWVDGMLSRRRRSERYAAALNALPSSAGEEDPTQSRDHTIRHVLEKRKKLLKAYAELLHNKTLAGFVMVAIAERMPMLETVNLYEQLTQMGVPVLGAVINRRSPTDHGEFLAHRAQAEAEHIAWFRQQLPEVAMYQTGLIAGDIASAEGLEKVAATFDVVHEQM